jgi:cobalamin biosynthesis protein CobT
MAPIKKAKTIDDQLRADWEILDDEYSGIIDDDLINTLKSMVAYTKPTSATETMFNSINKQKLHETLMCTAMTAETLVANWKALASQLEHSIPDEEDQDDDGDQEDEKEDPDEENEEKEDEGEEDDDEDEDEDEDEKEN